MLAMSTWGFAPFRGVVLGILVFQGWGFPIFLVFGKLLTYLFKWVVSGLCTVQVCYKENIPFPSSIAKEQGEVKHTQILEREQRTLSPGQGCLLGVQNPQG